VGTFPHINSGWNLCPALVGFCAKAPNKVLSYLAVVVMGVIPALDSFFLDEAVGCAAALGCEPGTSATPNTPPKHPKHTPQTPGGHSLWKSYRAVSVLKSVYGFLWECLGMFPACCGRDSAGRWR